MTGSDRKQTLVGIDVGGTFTDFVWLREGKLHIHKAATTPADQSRAIVAGLEALGVDATAPIVHGTTVATNALLERRGARTALLTTRGFADVLAIGRQDRPHLYRLSQHRPPPLVPQHLRLEITERLDHTGTIIQPLDEKAIPDIVSLLRDEQVESLAIVFLFSFQEAAHEQRTAALIRDHLPDLPLSLSSSILPEYREYERTATTVINAYVRPLVARYLHRLETTLPTHPISMMQSNGGTVNVRQASEHAARLVLSGPAGGVVGAFGLARQAMGIDTPHILTFDMGGTSTDVALCPGTIPHTSESIIADLPLRLPSTEIHTVGAGGGSIARTDTGGVLRVGPESAGADPGPACYGRGGTRPTVTDANLILGRLGTGAGPDELQALSMDEAAAQKVLTQLGTALHLSTEAAALGVVRVANAAMERALRRVSVERGHDPRDYVLVPFGGAGPLHACDLADALRVRRILVPRYPGVLSALGLLMADVVHDTSRAVLQSFDTLLDAPDGLHATVKALSEQVRGIFSQNHQAAPQLTATLDLRYVGQSYELSIPLDLPVSTEYLEQTQTAFHDAHEQRYGYATPERPIEAVTVRMQGRVPGTRIDLPEEPVTATKSDVARLGEKPVWFGADGPTDTPCYHRDKLRHGHCLDGPALVFQYDTTLVVAPGWRGRVDAWRNLWLEH